MIIRKANERGVSNLGWLDSRHTFSFGEYMDRRHMGYRSLRVINDDRVAAGQGFGAHGHRDMEIVTLVLDGSLEHKDSLGHGQVLVPGEVQVMSAGSGIRHSEFNPSSTAGAHFLQIWILPDQVGVQPRYAQRAYPRSERTNMLKRVAGGGSDADGAIAIHQDAHLFLGALEPGASVTHEVREGRGSWIHVAVGKARVNGTELDAGDGAALEGPVTVSLEAMESGTEVLVFDLQ